MPDAVEVARRQQRLGAATPICSECIRSGRETMPMEAFVGRPLRDEQTAFLWWECPSCHALEGPVTVPIAFMLATEVRADRVDRLPEAPSVFYTVDDAVVTFYVDPADGSELIRLNHGDVGARN